MPIPPRRAGLALVALLLSIASGNYPAAALSPLVAVMVLAALEFRPLWLAPAALLLGLTAEIFRSQPHLGAWPVALATAGWLALRGRNRLAPGGPAGLAVYGLLGGLVGRVTLLMFMQFAAIPLGAGAVGFVLSGALLDGLATILLGALWGRPGAGGDMVTGNFSR